MEDVKGLRKNKEVGDYMRILYKNMGFGGGAPKSLLEYVKIAKNNHYEVKVVGQYTFEPLFYHRENIMTYDLPFFKLNKPLTNLVYIYKYYKVYKEVQPDIIHTITCPENIIHKSLKELFGIPVIYTIPGGNVSKYTPLILRNEKIIVFSQENKKALENEGYDSNKIKVISNRIDFNAEEYSQKKNIDSYEDVRIISLLLVSRLVDGKIKSVEKVLEMAEKLNDKFGNIELKILGEGPYIKEIKQKAKKINDKYGKEVVKVLGHKTNVVEYIEKAHIIFGKGRCVIDPTVLERHAVAVNEEKKMEIVNSGNIDRMSEYNFSARDVEERTDDKKLFELVHKLLRSEINYDQLKEIGKKVRKKYDINEVKDEILNIYEEALNDRKKKRIFPIRLVRFMIAYIKTYLIIIKNRKSN